MQLTFYNNFYTDKIYLRYLKALLHLVKMSGGDAKIISNRKIKRAILSICKIYLSCLYILLALSCNTKKDKELPTDKIQVKEFNDYIVIGDSIIESKIENMPQLSYCFISIDSGFILQEIKVYRDTKLIQKIHVNQPYDRKEIRLIDWNLDGYKDLSVLTDRGSGGSTYIIWDYLPEKEQYLYNKSLSNIMGLEIDTVSKYIVFHNRLGYSEENWDTLKYINNKLEFVKGLFRTTYSNEKGEM